jgi:hypothetical protein
MLGVPAKAPELVDRCIQQLIAIRQNRKAPARSQTLLAEHLETFDRLKALSLSVGAIEKIRYRYHARDWGSLAPFCDLKKRGLPEKIATIFFDFWIKAAPQHI